VGHEKERLMLYAEVSSGGGLGLTSDDFNVVTLPSGLTQATATSDVARFRFQDVQRALNAAAKALGVPGRVKVTGAIDPPTAELALTVVQKAPAGVLTAHPTLMSLSRLLAADAVVAMTGAPRFIALSAEAMAAGFAAIQPIKVRLSSGGVAVAVVGTIALLTLGGAVIHWARQ
jgi:hypothetical protein